MSGVEEMEPLPLDAGRTKGVLSKMRAIWEMVRDAGAAWVDDYASSMGAALSYYTLFSLAPLLLIVISVAGMVFGTDAARAAKSSRSCAICSATRAPRRSRDC